MLTKPHTSAKRGKLVTKKKKTPKKRKNRSCVALKKKPFHTTETNRHRYDTLLCACAELSLSLSLSVCVCDFKKKRALLLSVHSDRERSF